MSVGGLLLAAGEGRRLGRPKALVPIDGETLADRAVRTLRDGGCAPIVAVSGAVALDLPGVTVVHNPDWASGMASSLAVGLAAFAGAAGTGVTAVVIALVDQPLVTAEIVRRLRESHAAGATVAVATYGGRRGNPVLIAREHWAAVVESSHADAGARAFLAAHPDLVTAVPCDDAGAPDDIDTEADLRRLGFG